MYDIDFEENVVVLGSIFRQKVHLFALALLYYSICNTVGWSIASIYIPAQWYIYLGSDISAIDVFTVLYNYNT